MSELNASLSAALSGSAYRGMLAFRVSGSLLSLVASGSTIASLAINGATALGFSARQTSDDDLEISLHNGQQFAVSLKGSTTLDDVIHRIQGATGNLVAVTIDTTDKCLELQDNTTGPGTFSISALNDSLAGAPQVGLGLLGSERDGDGVIKGVTLSGDNLGDHLFLRNVSLDAAVDLSASNISTTANFGLVGIGISGGTASAHAETDFTLAGGGRIDLSELTAALGSVSPQFIGSAAMTLPAVLQTSLLSLGSQPSTTLAVSSPDITDPAGLSLSVSGSGLLTDFQELTPSSVLAAFNDVVGALQAMEASGVLTNALPLLNRGFSNLVQTASALSESLAQTVASPEELLGARRGLAAGVGHVGDRLDGRHGAEIPLRLRPGDLQPAGGPESRQPLPVAGPLRRQRRQPAHGRHQPLGCYGANGVFRAGGRFPGGRPGHRPVQPRVAAAVPLRHEPVELAGQGRGHRHELQRLAGGHGGRVHQ